MADIKATDLPEKLWAAADLDKVITIDSEDGYKVKLMDATKFKWPTGDTWPAWSDWVPWVPWADWQDGEWVATWWTTGQILSKASNTDFDTEWIDAPDSWASTWAEVSLDTTWLVAGRKRGRSSSWIRKERMQNIQVKNCYGEFQWSFNNMEK